MAGVIAGSVGIEVYPDASQFWPKFKSQTQAGAQAASEELARSLTSQLPAKIADAIRQGLGNPATTRTQGQRTGAQYADAFTGEVKAKLDAAARSLGPRITVDANTAPAVAELEALRARADQLGAEITYGVDDKRALADVEALRVQLATLSRNSPDIRVRVDAGGAAAQLAALQTQLTALDGAARKAADPSGGMGSLAKAALVLAPALIPVGASVAPALLGVAGAAGVAALAFVGLKNGLDSASSQQVRGALQGVNSTLQELEAAAAKGIAPGLVQGLSAVQDVLPGLSTDVGLLAHDLGVIGGNVGAGVGSLLKALAPDMLSAADGAARLSAGFANIGNSPALRSFLDYAEAKLPQVGQLLQSTGTAFGHVVEAAAPWGSVVLSAVTGLGDAISAIPLPVLETLVTATEAYLAASLALKVVGPIFSGIGSAIGGVTERYAAATAAGAGFGVASLAALGPLAVIGGVAVGATYGITHMTTSLGDATSEYNKFTDAIRQDNDELGKQTKLGLATTLTQDGLAAAAQKSGVSMSDLVEGLTGSDADFKTLQDNLSKGGDLSFKQALGLESVRAGLVHDQGAAKLLDTYEQSLTTTTLQLSDTYAGLASSLGINSAAVGQYAKDLGLSDTSAAQFSLSVAGLAKSYATANAAQSALLDATIAYGNSAGAVADQAKYLGSALVASQGDALGTASAFASAYGASQDFESQVKSDSGLRQGLVQMADQLEGVSLSTADVTTYSDIFSNSAAPQITQALSGIQAQGEAAAQSWYQHAVGIEGTQQASQEASQVFTTTTHDALMGMLSDLHFNADQAAALADNLLSTPPTTESQIIMDGLDSAVSAIQTLAVQMANLDGHHYTSYFDLQYNIEDNPAADAYTSAYLDSISSANGNLIKAFGNGGFENHVAQIAPKTNTIRIWAEPETGGEAYIPMGSSKRARSTQILDTVADEFGYDLTPRNAAPSPIGSMTAGYGAVLPAGGGSADLVAEIRALRGEIRSGLAGLGGSFDQSLQKRNTQAQLNALSGSRRVNV
jgi:hypothetical protein